MGFPGMETAPPEQVTRAALFGGTTTLVDFAIQRPGNDIQAWRSAMDAGGKAYADYSYHIMLLPDISSATVAQVKTGIAEGFQL